MMSKITGVARNKVCGKRMLEELMDPSAQHSIDSVLNDALMGKETANFELRINRCDKEGNPAGLVVLLLSATPRLNSKGEIVGVVSLSLYIYIYIHIYICIYV